MIFTRNHDMEIGSAWFLFSSYTPISSSVPSNITKSALSKR